MSKKKSRNPNNKQNAALDPAVVVAVPPPSSSLLLSDDAASACLSDVDISSISDRTILENFSDQEARLVCLVCYKIFGPEEYSSFRSHVTNHKRSALSKVRLRQSHRYARYKYRAIHLVVDLGWFFFDLGVPPSCPSVQPLLPNSHQPRQNGVNPTQSTSR